MSNIINFGGGAPNIPTPFKPEGKSYLTFSSPNSFTLAVGNATKHWDGTLEYFASNKAWTTWDGTTTLSSVENDGEHVLYLRGTGNTVITGNIGTSNIKSIIIIIPSNNCLLSTSIIYDILYILVTL